MKTMDCEGPRDLNLGMGVWGAGQWRLLPNFNGHHNGPLSWPWTVKVPMVWCMAWWHSSHGHMQVIGPWTVSWSVNPVMVQRIKLISANIFLGIILRCYNISPLGAFIIELRLNYLKWRGKSYNLTTKYWTVISDRTEVQRTCKYN